MVASTCGLVPVAPTAVAATSASAGATGASANAKIAVPAIQCGWIVNCRPKCLYSGCDSCLPTADPATTVPVSTPSSTTTTSSTTTSNAATGLATAVDTTSAIYQCAASTLSPAERYCRQKYNFGSGCQYDPTVDVCVVPATANTDYTTCVTVLTATTPPTPPTSPTCPGANNLCGGCFSNSACAVLSLDPAKTGNVVYTCMDADSANVKSAALLGVDPTIPNSVITVLPPVCAVANLAASGSVGGSVGASTSKASASVIQIGQTLSVEDVEKGFMWCITNTISSTANIRQCDVQILSAKTGATTDPAGSANVDFSATFQHSITCPAGVALTQQDLTGDVCTCMKNSMKQVTATDFNGLCTGAISTTQKRATQQTSSTLTTTTMNTHTDSGSSSSAFSAVASLMLIVTAIIF